MQDTRSPKAKREQATKMIGLYREEQASPQAAEFRVQGGVYQPGEPCNRLRTKEFRENLVARNALMC